MQLHFATRPARLSDVPLDRARAVHRNFLILLQSHNREADERREGLRKFGFLAHQRDALDPKMGLFMTLHLLECLLVHLRNEALNQELSDRVRHLSELARHYAKRLGERTDAVDAYLAGVELEMAPRRHLLETRQGDKATDPSGFHARPGDQATTAS
jgi:hypothetical protein